MAMSQSRLAFSDCYELMEQAIADPKGIRVKFASEDDAFHYRLRLHNARKIDRHDNLQVFEEGHSMHGKSPYDVLVMRIERRDKQFWLRLEKLSLDGMEIESLSDGQPYKPMEIPEPPKDILPIPTVQRVEPIFRRRI
jgi:hypothetical protein